MPAQITNYQCPACTGPLHFDSKIGKLKCDYCGSEFTAQEIEEYYAAKNDAAEAAAEAAAQAAEEQAAAQSAQGAADTSVPEGFEEFDAAAQPEPSAVNTENAGDGWSPQEAGKMKAYSCTSCGAELVCEETTAATSCPYCGNPTVIPGQFAMDKPDYVIPFEVDKDSAIAALKNYYQGKFLLPSSFTKSNHIEKIQGVYVPFWMFNGYVDADLTLRAERSQQTRAGEYLITKTRHYSLRRAGKVFFSKIPVDASTKMPDDLMDSIEPYDYGKLKPFSMSYLPGFLANKYDENKEECAKRADTRAANTTVPAVLSTVSGYDSTVVEAQKLDVHRDRTEYALLPVWILSTTWNKENFLFAMNGQTGQLTGNLPVSKLKLFGIFIALTAFFSLIGMLLTGMF